MNSSVSPLSDVAYLPTLAAEIRASMGLIVQ